MLLPTELCEWFFGGPKSSLRAGLSGPCTRTPKREENRADPDTGLFSVSGEKMPSALRILRFAGLKVDGAPGDMGRLLPLAGLNGLFGTLGLGGKKCWSGSSCKGPGRRIGIVLWVVQVLGG